MTTKELRELLIQLGSTEPNISVLLNDSLSLPRMSAMLDLFQKNHDAHQENATTFNSNLLLLKEQIESLTKQLDTVKAQITAIKSDLQAVTHSGKSQQQVLKNSITDYEKNYHKLLSPVLNTIIDLQEQMVGLKKSTFLPKPTVKSQYKVPSHIQVKINKLTKKPPSKITVKKK